jgi:hypothetical protein
MLVHLNFSPGTCYHSQPFFALHNVISLFQYGVAICRLRRAEAEPRGHPLTDWLCERRNQHPQRQRRRCRIEHANRHWRVRFWVCNQHSELMLSGSVAQAVRLAQSMNIVLNSAIHAATHCIIVFLCYCFVKEVIPQHCARSMWLDARSL